MTTLTLEIPEAQIVEWVRQLSPVGKNAVLRALVPHLDSIEEMVIYGGQRIRAICAEQGINWDTLTEAERQAVIDQLLHEPADA